MLKAPDFKDHDCQVPGCKFRGCTGNITFWVNEAEDILAFRCLAVWLLRVQCLQGP